MESTAHRLALKFGREVKLRATSAYYVMNARGNNSKELTQFQPK